MRGDSYSNGLLYATAIARAGGITMTVPPLAESVEHVARLVASVDGVLIQGGGDVAPERYGDSRRSNTVYGVVDEHDDLEIALVREVVRQDKPLLAICRGLQVLNVALGGTLHQDLGDVLADRESHWNTYHEISITPGTRLANAMGTVSPERSHSYHHQAVKNVAAELDVVAKAPDGVIEAVEHRTCNWVLGVQWHPEDDAGAVPHQQSLFDALVAKCAGN